ncbi:MAG: non-canonical purine NTP pyrophosphatase, partial [Candidatus Pacebacteria bacterium]|nr:non-canonical purine NTP pyrophosphatase [Candidatus Paceibacterota bacterium]MBT7183916.1 non-canonical purine NTP pyrophosphatase [Candidatus Paceibacterota bacterium]MBT7499432.1 non-canonical purine NTP pyrophosphatase [Candidatus Paceibacterota bacterium]
MKLLLGTTNQGKLKEAKQLLSDLKFDLLSLDDLENLPEIIVEENGETFAENALLKAQAYGHLSGILTLAEDAGLEVNTLDGKPGVKSARLGVNADVRNRKLLSLLKNKKDRSARFVSVFCLYDPQTKKTDYFRGEIEGKISTELKGNQGFDYDYL